MVGGLKFYDLFPWLLGAFCGLMGAASAGAQEAYLPLRYNPRTMTNLPGQVLRSTDTLALPFEDDFCYEYSAPNPALWDGARVFRNNEFGIAPPSCGVLTLDGLDSLGYPYDNSSLQATGRCDFLTTKALRLGSLAASDSVYLSFAYQPAGWGEAPEPSDSLVLEFLKANGQWARVWFALGSGLQPFRHVLVAVLDSACFFDGFRARWVNVGSMTGLVDCWNLDYVRLASGRNAGDSLRNDVALVQPNASLLRPYRSMPWSQFAADTGRFLNPLHGVNLYNTGSAVSVNHRYDVTLVQASSPSGTLWYQSPAQTLSSVGAQNSYALSYPRLFALPQPTGDSLELRYRYAIQAAGDVQPANDTLTEVCRWWNHLAYDDGTAETGYGINVTAGSVAYKFWLAQPDTLRGLWMYFTQAAANAANELFVLKVWSYLQERGRAAVELYRSSVPYRPRYGDSIGHFMYFAIDPPVVVRDSFYVGWQQETSGLVNIGLDRNDTLVRYNRWYNTQGIWEESSLPGSWMIRPVLGGPFRYPATIPALPGNTRHGWTLYPKPGQTGTGSLFFKGSSKILKLRLLETTGKTVLSWNSQDLEGSLTEWDNRESGFTYRLDLAKHLLGAGTYFWVLEDISQQTTCLPWRATSP